MSDSPSFRTTDSSSVSDAVDLKGLGKFKELVTMRRFPDRTGLTSSPDCMRVESSMADKEVL
jgi:hypothetical protein